MKSDREWKYWGAADPLFAVASWKGKQAGSPTAWTADEFLKLGYSDVADITRHWRDYGMQEGALVEIGCGAGRMTRPLLSHFDEIHALDVSPDQVATARRLLEEDAGRVTFHIVDRPAIPLPDDSSSAMFSCHVFQHFSEFGGIVAYLRETYRVLRPGATICFHIPVPGAHLTSTDSLSLRVLRNLKVVLKRLAGSQRLMEYHRYPADQIFRTLASIGFTDSQLRIFPMTSNGDFHSFFFARKA